MNKHVNAIAGRLSLRKPQRESLEILDRITEIAPPKKDGDVAAALAAIRAEYPSVTDFERDFPSVCFALATGVGKTRLMGAFIAYLHAAHGLNNFFVLAPNLTIYKKLIADFTPNTPKYVFKGLAEFATEPPHIVTGDSYEQTSALPLDAFARCSINIFNISKINSEVRGGKAPRIKRLSEYIGQSYFDYLAGLPDLVLLMDESHRYRASAGVKAINELKPILGLELTATPEVEVAQKPVKFKNVIYDYALGRALEDGFVKEPAVVTRKDFDPKGMSVEQIELLKLEDGIALHERTKTELETYGRANDCAIVKPFLLVIARDTTHATDLVKRIESEHFFGGAYKGKVIQVDSSRSGAEEEEMIERLLKVEHADEPTEIVVHVNMLKEGWDVTNLYTIVPLRAANARVLIQQSIGRGLRLPYGKRTDVPAVDTLSIVAHDKFQEIVDEARKDDSPIRLRSIVLEAGDLARITTVASVSVLDAALGRGDPKAPAPGLQRTAPIFTSPIEQAIAQTAEDVIRRFEREPALVPSIEAIRRPEVQARIVEEVTRRHRVAQGVLDGMEAVPDFARIVAKTTQLAVEKTIDIPCVIVVPKGNVKSGFRPFTLDLTAMRYQPVSDELWMHVLRTGESRAVTLTSGGGEEPRPENYVVRALIDYDEISYDDHADLLYDLAGQVVRHLSSYLGDADVKKVLRCHEVEIGRFVRAQLAEHRWEEAAEYEARVTQGFTLLKGGAFTTDSGRPVYDYRSPPTDGPKMSTVLFGGFERCLYDVQKFDSDAERRMAEILERDSERWFKPSPSDFHITYRDGPDHRDYRPDFVAEASDTKYMLEPKAANELEDPIVLAKRAAAVTWCKHATDHAKSNGGKPWRYVLIPHDAIRLNMTLEGLGRQYGS